MIKSWRRGLAKSLANFRNEDGAAAVEFAVLSPAFIAMVLISTMVAVLFLAKSELDYATQRVARLIMTRQVTTASALQTQLCNYVSAVISCSGVMVNLTSYSSLASMNTSTPTLTYTSGGAVSNTWNTQFGSAGSIMVLQIMYQYPVIGGLMINLTSQSTSSDLLISTAVFVNE
jgi:Flp pilus assembly protein TadG